MLQINPINNGIGQNTIAGFGLLEVLLMLLLFGLLAEGGGEKLADLNATFKFRHTSEQLLANIHLQSLHASLLDQTVTLRAASNALLLCDQAACGITLFALPATMHISMAKFRQPTDKLDQLSLYSDGSASPGSLRIRDRQGRYCDLIQALRGRRTLHCGKL